VNRLGARSTLVKEITASYDEASDTCQALAEGKIYVIAGWTTYFADQATMEVMDPTATTPAWTAAPDLPAKRGDLTCAVSGDKIYAFGGYYDPAGTWAPDSFHNTTFEFDPATNMWASMVGPGGYCSPRHLTH